MLIETEAMCWISGPLEDLYHLFLKRRAAGAVSRGSIFIALMPLSMSSGSSCKVLEVGIDDIEGEPLICCLVLRRCGGRWCRFNKSCIASVCFDSRVLRSISSSFLEDKATDSSRYRLRVSRKSLISRFRTCFSAVNGSSSLRYLSFRVLSLEVIDLVRVALCSLASTG